MDIEDEQSSQRSAKNALRFPFFKSQLFLVTLCIICAAALLVVFIILFTPASPESRFSSFCRDVEIKAAKIFEEDDLTFGIHRFDVEKTNSLITPLTAEIIFYSTKKRGDLKVVTIYSAGYYFRDRNWTFDRVDIDVELGGKVNLKDNNELIASAYNDAISQVYESIEDSNLSIARMNTESHTQLGKLLRSSIEY